VQAYFGPLPAGEQGIEFYTTALPHQTGLPDGFGANWYLEDTPFTGEITVTNREGVLDRAAVITIMVARHQP
jgi:hypothetical protein